MTIAALKAPAPDAGAYEYEDAAWLRIATSLSVADLRAFLDDLERLYRINPLLEISTFEAVGEGQFRIEARNLSNATDLDVMLDVRAEGAGVDVHYDQGLKTMTLFRVEAAPEGSHLVVTEVYGSGSAAERRARVSEVDLSLNAWGRALSSYLGMWARWRWFRPWRWYMRRVWQPMKPSARRIVWMIWVISAFELIIIGALLGILGVWRLATL